MSQMPGSSAAHDEEYRQRVEVLTDARVCQSRCYLVVSQVQSHCSMFHILRAVRKRLRTRERLEIPSPPPAGEKGESTSKQRYPWNVMLQLRGGMQPNSDQRYYLQAPASEMYMALRYHDTSNRKSHSRRGALEQGSSTAVSTEESTAEPPNPRITRLASVDEEQQKAQQQKQETAASSSSSGSVTRSFLRRLSEQTVSAIRERRGSSSSRRGSVDTGPPGPQTVSIPRNSHRMLIRKYKTEKFTGETPPIDPTYFTNLPTKFYGTAHIMLIADELTCPVAVARDTPFEFEENLESKSTLKPRQTKNWDQELKLDRIFAWITQNWDNLFEMLAGDTQYRMRPGVELSIILPFVFDADNEIGEVMECHRLRPLYMPLVILEFMRNVAKDEFRVFEIHSFEVDPNDSSNND